MTRPQLVHTVTCLVEQHDVGAAPARLECPKEEVPHRHVALLDGRAQGGAAGCAGAVLPAVRRPDFRESGIMMRKES